MSEINFVQVDTQTILSDLISAFESTYGYTLYPGDERRIFLNQMASVLASLYNSINDTGRQNLLKYARGEILDALGDRLNTPRLPASKATTTLRFTLSAAQSNDITIPKGTRATPDGQLFWATDTALVIPAGSTYGDISATALDGGKKYNGFTSGQISTLVDPVAFVASVANTTTSSGGTDIEADDNGVNVWSGYRERIREAPTSFSSAGPSDSYVYWAKTASADIADVKVMSPSAGQVKIIVLMKNGQMPSSVVLDAVLAACNDRKRRPLTDQVTAAAPTTTSYNITLTYYISNSRASEESTIRAAIENTGKIIDQYKAWQNAELGRDISPDYLRQLLYSAGAYRVDITAPVFTAVADDKVAAVGTVTLTYGGLL